MNGWMDRWMNGQSREMERWWGENDSERKRAEKKQIEKKK